LLQSVFTRRATAWRATIDNALTERAITRQNHLARWRSRHVAMGALDWRLSPVRQCEVSRSITLSLLNLRAEAAVDRCEQ